MHPPYPEYIQKELARLLPLSILDDIACFVFYDNHPQDRRFIDIVIVTKNGELKEYYQRDMITSVFLGIYFPPQDIIIMRNSACKLYYLVNTVNAIRIVLSKKRETGVVKLIPDVESFAVDDWGEDGQPLLKVILKDDAVPIYFDENFEDVEALYEANPRADSVPLLSELKRKYIEAQHTVNNQEKAISEYVRLRQAATFYVYENLHTNERDCVLKARTDTYGTLKIKTQMPWVKVCNTYLVIALNVLNDYEEPLTNFQLLLTAATIVTLAYSTKLFIKTDTLPFWKETTSALPPNIEAAAVAVMPLDELQATVTDLIKVKGALSYKCGEKAYLMPFEDVVISSLTTYGDSFNPLSSKEFDPDTMLAIIATCHRTNLRIRVLTPGDTLINLLVQYLQMEKIAPDVIMYKKSPYHTMNGAMLHFNDDCTGHSFTAVAYTRTKLQLLTLIHHINTLVPAKTIITPINYAIRTCFPSMEKFSETTPDPTRVDYLGYAKTVVNRTTRILEYLDYCMVKMNESKDPKVHQQIGFQIDLYGCGKTSYDEFRDAMLEEERNGIECLLRKPVDSQPMTVD